MTIDDLIEEDGRDLFNEYTPEELRVELHARGIKVVVFDLDDTLVKTHELFEIARRQFCETIAPLVGQDYDVVYAQLYQAIKNTRPTHSVQQNLWDAVLEEMISIHYAEHTSVHGDIMNCKPIFEKIYNTVSELREETLTVLEKLHAAGIPMYVVTHAEKDWTDLKIDGNGIRKYFEKVFVVPAHTIKDPEQWSVHVASIIKETRTLRRNMLVLGDNLERDIISTQDINIGHHGLVLSTPWSELGIENLRRPVYKHGNIVSIFNKILNTKVA